jgi:seryl-tRNA synthetase
MLAANKVNKPIDAVLRVDMVVNGERRSKGDVVELSNSNFKYLAQHDRVAEATDENIAAVKVQIKSEKEAADRAKLPSESETLKARIANLEAELAAAKGK